MTSITIDNTSNLPDKCYLCIHQPNKKSRYITAERVYRKPTVKEFLIGLNHFRWTKKIATPTFQEVKENIKKG